MGGTMADQRSGKGRAAAEWRWAWAATAMAAAVASACATTTEPAATPGADTQAQDAAAALDTAQAVDAALGQDAAATVDVSTAADAAKAQVTWHKDIQPLIRDKCAGCHKSNAGIAPFALDTYPQAKAMLGAAIGSIQAKTMPPWGAWETPECKPSFGWRHDLRLTAAQTELLKQWQAAGAPEGDVKDADPTPVKGPMLLDNPDLITSPASGFVTTGDHDQYRCFVLDAKFDETKYLNGIHVLPGNPLVVHHVLVFADANNSSAKLADKDGQYDCFGSAMLTGGGRLLTAWAPGSVPVEYPQGMGSEIAKGSKLVMQVHYHPSATPAAPDVTKIQLRYTKAAPTMRGETVLIGNFGSNKNGEGLLAGPNDAGGKAQFFIPAGAKNHTEEMLFTIPAQLDGKATPELKVYGVGTHMHYVGRNMRISVERSAATLAACTSTELAPLSTCLTAKCPGKTGMDLATCAQTACKDSTSALSKGCGDCLIAGVTGGKPSDQIMTSCTTAVEQTPAGPSKECLVETPAWDFNWQRIYVYDAPVEKLPVIRAGDKIRLRCQYDNSLDNPFVAEALKEQGKSAPADVVLGEETLDEMCLALVQILYTP